MLVCCFVLSDAGRYSVSAVAALAAAVHAFNGRRNKSGGDGRVCSSAAPSKQRRPLQLDRHGRTRYGHPWWARGWRM